MRLKLVPDETNFAFFRYWRYTFGASVLAMVLSIVAFLVMGLNFGIDFKGGTTIRTEAVQPVDIGAYRDAIAPLGYGDVAITEVFDPSFGPEQNVAMVRIQAQEGQESKTPEQLAEIRTALQQVDPSLSFASVDSVGPKVSGELVQSAVISVLLALGAILFYVWLRFEWQFSVGAVAALVHDVVLTIGLFRGAANRVRPVDHRGAADHRGLFAERHRGRLRPCAREPDKIQETSAARGVGPCPSMKRSRAPS